jgi:hypothetical protein
MIRYNKFVTGVQQFWENHIITSFWLAPMAVNSSEIFPFKLILHNLRKTQFNYV